MTYNEMVNIASKAIIQSNTNGSPVGANDTVCVVHSAKNLVYTAFSTTFPNGDNSHAEINILKQLVANNDTAVLGMTVIHASTLSFVMPCSNCISTFLKQNPMNSNAVVVTPNAFVPILQIFNQQPYMGYYQPVNLATPVQLDTETEYTDTSNVFINDEDSSSGYLKNKLDMLFGDEENEENDNQENKENEKKGFFGFFGRKNNK